MVKIFADTSSSIPVNEAIALGIEYFPQIIVFGEKTYRDDIEMDLKTFLEKLNPPQLYLKHLPHLQIIPSIN